jgi:hypothetical protein
MQIDISENRRRGTSTVRFQAKHGNERKQAKKIVQIGREPGLEPATPDEARTILNLKGLDKVKY